MVLSQTSVYALKALLYIAEAEEGTFVRVDDVATALDVPRNYLSKILHALGRASVVESSRGPQGGFRLAIAPERLSLYDVIRHFDSFVDQSSCLLGRTECSDSDPCRAHARWKAVSSALERFFRETTIADLALDPGAATLDSMV